MQNTKQHPFLIHADSVHTICVLFLAFLVNRMHDVALKRKIRKKESKKAALAVITPA